MTPAEINRKFEDLPVEVQGVIKYAYTIALTCDIGQSDYSDNLALLLNLQKTCDSLNNLLENIEALWPEQEWKGRK